MTGVGDRDRAAGAGRRWKRTLLEVLPATLFIMSCFGAGLAYGMVAMKKDIFPVPTIRNAYHDMKAALSDFMEEKTISIPGDGSKTGLVNGGAVAPGLILVSGMGADRVNFARIVDRSGKIIQEYRLDWFGMKTDDLHVPEDRRPKSKPGTLVHGMAMLPDGDIVFHFEHLVTVRLDPCSKPKWVVENLGHHSVEIDDDGNLWVPTEHLIPEDADTGYANHEKPLRDWTIEKMSPDGKILRTISVIDILTRNDLLGLLHLSTIADMDTAVHGDTLHLNDVEVFPKSLPEGVFKHGDLLISLRNISTVLVVDPKTLKVRYRITGVFLRQHDPDFVSGNRLLVFDNRNLLPHPEPQAKRSRILSINAATGEVREVFKPKGKAKFFSHIMGKQQLLPNGNLLITVAWEGRAIEVNPDGEMVWQYINATGEKTRGLVSQATLLPPEMNAEFFEKLKRQCGPVS